MHILPQEIEVWYIIPAIRRDIAKILVNEYKISFEKVGNILGISKAAVSQYLANKRAAKIKLHEKAFKEIKKSCKKMMDGKSDSTKEILRILELIRKKHWHCKKCGKLIGIELHDCEDLPYMPVLVKVKRQ